MSLVSLCESGKIGIWKYSVGFLRDGKTITPREKPLEVTRLKKVLYIHPGQVVFGLGQVTFLASYIFLCDQLHISPYNINYCFITQSSQEN